MDLFDLLRQGISQQRAKLKQTEKDAKTAIKKTEKQRKRIKRGGEMFADLFNARIIGANNAIANVQEELKVCELAEALIKDCEMEVDQNVSPRDVTGLEALQS